MGGKAYFADMHELLMQGLDFVLYELLKDSPYVTKNPDEADFFFFPVYPYWSKKSDPYQIVQALKSKPYWERKKGAGELDGVQQVLL